VTWFGSPRPSSRYRHDAAHSPNRAIMEADDYRRRCPDGRTASDPSPASIEAGDDKKIVGRRLKAGFPSSSVFAAV